MQATTALNGTGHPDNFNKFRIPLQWALVAAPLMVALQALAYMVILPKSFMGGTMLALFIQQFPILPVAFYFLAGIQQRKAMGGYITFRESFSAMFLVLIFVDVALAVWGVVYAKYIDPEIGQKLMDGFKGFMESIGRPREFIDQKMAEQAANLREGISAKAVLLGLGQSILFHSVVAMLCSLIVRKKRPQAVA